MPGRIVRPPDRDARGRRCGASSTGQPTRPRRWRSAPSRRWPSPAGPARWRWSSCSSWPPVGLIERPATDGLTGARLARLVALAILGGAGFIAAINIAVALSGPTITGFVAPLYAVLATVFAVPILGEPVRRIDRRGIRRRARRHGPAGGNGAARSAVGRDRDGLRRGRDVRAVPRPGPALVRPVPPRWHARDHRQPAGARPRAAAVAVVVDPRPLVPASLDPAARRSPSLSIVARVEQHGQPAGHGQRPPGPGRTDVGRAAADARSRRRSSPPSSLANACRRAGCSARR